jgi:hypothetical protein
MAKSASALLLSAAIALLLQAEPALALKCDETEPQFSRWELVHTLRRDGFPEVMVNEYVELNRIGNIKVNDGVCFTFYSYKVEFNRGTRVTKRLLLLKNWSYIGMYPIDDVEYPIGVFGNTIVFLDSAGVENKAVFDKEKPADEIYLGGAPQTFMKPKR